MNRRLLGILLTAFVIAAACSYLVYRVVGNKLMTAQPKSTRVVVAALDIKLGTLLHSSDLTTGEIVGTPPKGVILKLEDAIGRGVVSDIYQGEAISDSRLAAVGSGGGLAATIRKGMRACAVKVDDVVGVAGFVTPGMRVDVLISGNPPSATASTEGTVVKTLLQNIEVLSAGLNIQKDNEGKPQQVQVVNLLVTPEQAESLSLASNQTKIQLVLRNPLDTEISQTPGTAMATLFAMKGGTKAKVLPVTARRSTSKVEKQMYMVEVFNGQKRSEAKFANGEAKQ